MSNLKYSINTDHEQDQELFGHLSSFYSEQLAIEAAVKILVETDGAGVFEYDPLIIDRGVEGEEINTSESACFKVSSKLVFYNTEDGDYKSRTVLEVTLSEKDEEEVEDSNDFGWIRNLNY